MTQGEMPKQDDDATLVMNKEDVKRCLAAPSNLPVVVYVKNENYQIILKSINEVDWVLFDIHELLVYQEVQRLRNEVVKLCSRQIRHWVVDISRLSICDSTILGLCIMVIATVRGIDGKVTIRMVRDSQIHDAFRSTRLDQILPVEFYFIGR